MCYFKFDLRANQRIYPNPGKGRPVGQCDRQANNIRGGVDVLKSAATSRSLANRG